MNIETGEIYRGKEEISRAASAGADVIPVSKEQADALETVKPAGRAEYLSKFAGLNRHQRRKLKKLGYL